MIYNLKTHLKGFSDILQEWFFSLNKYNRKIHFILSNTSLAKHIKGMTYWPRKFRNSSIGGTPSGCYLGLEQVGVWCDPQKSKILNIFSNNDVGSDIDYPALLSRKDTVSLLLLRTLSLLPWLHSTKASDCRSRMTSLSSTSNISVNKQTVCKHK